jgi:predicted AlkP superfamily pyrophosphatase or phosphodiesterase
LRLSRSLLLAVLAAVLAGAAAVASVTASAGKGSPTADHVLLLSVDGLHQSDLAWYANNHPSSALAKLVHTGVEFTHARTPFPSDSFPGLVAQVTGGNP